MSKATKRKHVTREVLEDFIAPTGEQTIVKVICGKGNNLHEVETHTGRRLLASMPTKFRRNVWIKRGDFVIVEPIPEGHKVQAEIVHILYPKQIRDLTDQHLWPFPLDKHSEDHATKERDKLEEELGGVSNEKQEEEEEEEEDLFVNTNRQAPQGKESSESDSSEDER